MLVEFSRAFFVCTESELEWIFSQLDVVRERLRLEIELGEWLSWRLCFGI